MIKESFHADTEALPWAENWAGDPRIRLNSRKWDIVVALMLWLQLALGLLTVPLSAFHMDGVLFETLTS